MTELRNASNGVMNLLGEAEIVVTCNDKQSVTSTVLVAFDLNHSALISWQDLQKLRVILPCFQLMQLLLAVSRTLPVFSSVFYDTLDNKPTCAQKMKIFFKDNSVPY